VSSPSDQIGPIGGSFTLTNCPNNGPTCTGFFSTAESDGGKSWMGGYRAERNALLKFIADNHILNVVVLTTDDHQLRINELGYFTQFDGNGTPIQSSYVRAPRAFQIVVGPIGATGPDAITDHSIANILQLAENFEAQQIALGIDPIGLDPSYPGLHDVSREGDTQADTNRQPFDFYSPDTFNYATLEIGACPTLAVTVKGINSYAVNTFPQPSVANPLRQILHFEIDADGQPPAIQSVVAAPSVLWPPNHKMVPVTVTVGATDNCGVVSEKIVSVTSNESQGGSADWQVTGDLSLLLRAERDGSGSGRTYTITVEVKDAAGNASRRAVNVIVPHSMGGG
jgi:hypothetical protein